jgi:hypothetical protein
VAGFCEHANEPSGSIKKARIIDGRIILKLILKYESVGYNQVAEYKFHWHAAVNTIMKLVSLSDRHLFTGRKSV